MPSSIQLLRRLGENTCVIVSGGLLFFQKVDTDFYALQEGRVMLILTVVSG